MRDSDGAHLSTPAAGVDPPKSRWSRRLCAVSALLLVGLNAELIAGVSPTVAAPSLIVTPTTDVPPIGRWVRGGAPVDIPGLFSTGTWYSDRANEPVEVQCVDGPLRTKVRGYFGSGDGLVAGWTSTTNVQTRGWVPPQCGLLDEAALTW